jgi:hypothetical protein
MKKLLFATVLLAVAALPFGTASAADVGVSVSIGQPGFYGRIDVGNQPPPQVIYPQPVVVAPAPYAVAQRPIYLRVPPPYARDWRRYCGRYNACGQPVYFVQDNWYRDVYAPRYREEHRHDRRGPPPGRGWDRDDRGHGHGKDRDRGRGPDRERGDRR